MPFNDDLQKELIHDLLVESFEGLDRYDREMLEIEKNAGGAESLNSIFRIVHTIKGTSGCIGFNKIESVAHVGENLLSLVREGKLTPHPEMITTLLELADALREMLRSVEANGTQGDADYSKLLQKLQDLQNPSASPAPAPAPAAPVPAAAAPAPPSPASSPKKIGRAHV